MTSSTTETLVDVLMPAMGSSVSEGTVTVWNKDVGEPVRREEPVCEISSDKTDADCPAPADGVLAEILVEAGATVDVGTPLARIATDRPAASSGADDGPRRCSPVVRRMASVHAIDLGQLPGTGRNGRVTKRDVQAFLDTRQDGSAAPGPDAEPRLHSESPYQPDPPRPRAPGPAPVQLSPMRQSIARAMTTSLQTAATCTTVVECDMTAVQTARLELGVTALPLVAHRVVETLRAYPHLNATLDGTALTLHDDVHLGIAVSLGDDGLVVPVVRNAQDLSIQGLGRRITDLAAAARARELGPDDFAGATFTITSPGRFGALLATPVINLPQVAILDLEAITRRPVVVADASGGESIAIRSMAQLCMSWDHRALDGAYAAQFLTALRRGLEAA